MFEEVAYAPGPCRAIVGLSTAMLLTSDDDLEERVVTGLWGTVRDAKDLQDVVDVLVEIGIRRLPSFGLLHVDGETANLLLRGTVRAVVHRLDAEPEPLAADGAVTWRELAVTGAAAIELESDDPPTTSHRPLLGGVVDAASLRFGELPAPAPAPVAPEEAAPAGEAADPGALVSSPEAEAVAVAPPEDDAAPDEDADLGDGHAGHTTVMAVRCPDGHANPPLMPSCRFCGQSLEAFDPVEVSRPVLGRLVFSDGTKVELDRPVVVGRAPKARRGKRGEEPQLVTLPSPEQENLRSHLEVRLDGWHVLVVDLGSTNGTVMTLPGAEPLLLRSGEEYRIKPGTTVAVADEVSFVYEVTERKPD